jgi:hypothetical protein
VLNIIFYANKHTRTRRGKKEKTYAHAYSYEF